MMTVQRLQEDVVLF